MTDWRLPGILLLLALLMSCASPEPPRYFTLKALATPVTGDSGLSLGLRPVQVPEYLRRNTIVRESENNRLELLTGARWAEPLEDGLRRVIALNLAATLPSRDVRRYPWSVKHPPAVVVTLQFLDLAVAEDKVSLVVESAIAVHEGSASSRLITAQQQLHTGAEAGDIAAAISQLIAGLSQTLAGDIRALTIDKETGSDA